MIYHIPEGSKIYFAKSAKLKREIENIALNIFYQNGYEEIHTPIFNFYNIENENTIRISTNYNKQIALRMDNTIDIINIIKCHLDNKINNKKWFYIQSKFSYPSKEIDQIGAEYLDKNSLPSLLNIAINIFIKLQLNPILQISNMQIPILCAKESNLNMNIFSQMQVDKLLNNNDKLNNNYLSSLLAIHNKQTLKDYIPYAPRFLKEELEILLSSASYCDYDNVIFSPLYYSSLGYYDSLFFRMFNGNRIFCIGGKYEIDKIHSCGFAIYTNELIDYIGDK